MAEKSRNVWEVYHTLLILVSNNSAVFGVYTVTNFIFTFFTKQ